MGNDPIQGSERAPKNALERRIRENAGWPSLREQKGHGVAVVLVGVTPDLGALESGVQGEARQGVQKKRGCWRVMRLQTILRGFWKLESRVHRKDACTVWGRGVGKGL